MQGPTPYTAAFIRPRVWSSGGLCTQTAKNKRKADGEKQRRICRRWRALNLFCVGETRKVPHCRWIRSQWLHSLRPDPQTVQSWLKLLEGRCLLLKCPRERAVEMERCSHNPPSAGHAVSESESSLFPFCRWVGWSRSARFVDSDSSALSLKGRNIQSKDTLLEC